MTRLQNISAAVVNPAGLGKPGYCTLCAINDDLSHELDQQIKAGRKVPQINIWLEKVGIGAFTRQTIYKHKKHVFHPQDRLVNAVQRRQMKGTLPATTTKGEFLDSIVAVAHQRVIDNPDEVTIEHGLRAEQIRLQAKASKTAGLNLLVAFMTRGAPEDFIEGVATEVQYQDA